ncbi:phage tail tip protein J-related protein, partial [Morganella morganii]|uniref:phage tail tip protein J-related protein n=1 Tax=Morganella morganii TaxID=582 RepID=UPI003B9DE8F0
MLTVTPQNDRGQKGEPASTSFSVNPPLPPSYIEVEPGYFSLGIVPRSGGQNSLRAQYEFWFSDKQVADIRDVESVAAYLGNGTMWIVQGRNMKAGHRYYVYVRSVNVVGKSIFVEASGIPESNADEILDAVQKELEDSAIIKDLQSQADDNFEAIINNANNAYGQWGYWQRENGAMKAE